MIFNSDYPEIYIAKTFSARMTTADQGWGIYVGEARVSHNLPFKPLIRGIWSTDPNFSWANDLDAFSRGGFGNSPDISLDTYLSRDSDLFFRGSSIDKSVTFYIKGILIAPPNFTGNIAEFDTLGAYKFNSDKRYNKLFASGELPIGGGTVTHNLGYLPICWVFEKGQYGSLSVNKTKITEQQLIVQTPNGATDNGFYYFILKDGYDGKG